MFSLGKFLALLFLINLNKVRLFIEVCLFKKNKHYLLQSFATYIMLGLIITTFVLNIFTTPNVVATTQM